MKTAPITPARIDWSGDVPRSAEFDDIYHPRIGALEQARHVFLCGNSLPDRWRGRERFTILETGFGLGHNFLATWQAWRDDPGRCTRLHFVSIEKHPPRREDLMRSHGHAGLPELAADLHRQWPPLTPNLHELDFDDGRVQLLLAFGDATDLLPALQLAADAFFLDGFAPARNPALWSLPLLKALGRKAAAGATLATWSVAREVRDGLTRAGFEVQRAEGIGGKREISVARFAPRHVRPGWPAARVQAKEAFVIGAGVAGASAAAALRRQGLEVTVFDRHPQPALEASGNPGGLVHGSLHADDGPHARLLRTAALLAARELGRLIERGDAQGCARGLLWLDRRPGGLAAMRVLLAATALPPDYVQALDRDDASRRAGVSLDAPAWFYPGGLWVAPAEAVRTWLAGSRFEATSTVARLQRHAEGWQLLGADGRARGDSPLVVLCNAAGSSDLLQPLGHSPWPSAITRGQVSSLRGAVTTPLQLPLTGDGYALPLPDGRLLCGATRTPGDRGLEVRAADHAWNIERARRLTGLDLPVDPALWEGRAGHRMHARDRLPIAGSVALPTQPSTRATQARWLAREPGLFVISALGARGVTLAPLLGRVVAALATGAPCPLEQDLIDAIDPGRWQVRAARAPGARPAGAD